MPGLGSRLGRGGATTFLQDLANSDCIVIMGANMAENHPVGFRFVVQAQERGATVIHVDPRFTRTSALADQHVPLRAGSDMVFLGALIRHVIEGGHYNGEYVRHYTNASALVGDAFRDVEELGGLFSGYVARERRYDPASWAITATPGGQPSKDERGAASDPTLQHPRCVFQVLRRHFARYTPEMVADVCGVEPERFAAVADAIVRNSTPDRTTAFAYAMAWTQHTTGTQMISCCAILQLLLGNVGRPGGGVMALRGHATIQGSTDIPTLFDLLPGYLPMPTTERAHGNLAAYLDDITVDTCGWADAPAYTISLLKAYYGDAAHPANDFGYGYLPQIGGDYSFQQMLIMMRERVIRGLLCMGQNPAVGGQNARLGRRALGQLDWLVLRDAFEIESASFWKDSPEVLAGEIRPEEIGTEVFLMPAALTPEKEGSYTNTQRLMQWHDKAVEPPGDARSEAWFVHRLAQRLRELYADDASPAAAQLRALTWEYPTNAAGDPDLATILTEINGYRVADRSPVSGFDQLRADGSTACGCWIYAGVAPQPGRNRARERDPSGPAALGWGFSWPANRRMLYNRASARPDGSPWSERKAWVWWDDAAGRWVGHDVPDFPVTKPPSYEPPPGARGLAALPGDAPFLMIADGLGQLYVQSALRDGPLPTHYEPWESPVGNHLYPAQPRNPAAIPLEHPENPLQSPQDPAYPHVITTYRLTEHHTGGGMSRYVPWLAELQPEGFAEIDPALAAALSLATGDWVAIVTARGEIRTRALVTARLEPLTVDGRTVHQIGMPWHFGYGGIATGASANDLTALVEDPNSRIHEGKSFACAVRKVLAPGPGAPDRWARDGERGDG
ncbi:MAG: molybdopterin-dependent oxidoreductase [Thermomicrobiales bacterium]|nr:molybdopterin-dependent oxidoreductase [Thermomicrobiales bacterium]